MPEDEIRAFHSDAPNELEHDTTPATDSRPRLPRDPDRGPILLRFGGNQEGDQPNVDKAALWSFLREQGRKFEAEYQKHERCSGWRGFLIKQCRNFENALRQGEGC